MNNIKSLFSSYQRTAMIILLAVLSIAIPITLILVGQQQDIRQRAEEIEEHSIGGPLTEEKLRSFCERCIRDDEDKNFVCGRTRGRGEDIKVNCREEASSSHTMCISCKDIPTPTASPTAAISPTRSPSATPTPILPPEYRGVIDFNDDGKIDELDLNILYSGFSRRKGD